VLSVVSVSLPPETQSSLGIVIGIVTHRNAQRWGWLLYGWVGMGKYWN